MRGLRGDAGLLAGRLLLLGGTGSAVVTGSGTLPQVGSPILKLLFISKSDVLPTDCIQGWAIVHSRI